MSSLRSAKRKLKAKNVRIAEMVAKKRVERGYNHFANRRSTNPDPLKGPTTAQLIYPDEATPPTHIIIPKDNVQVEKLTEDLSKKE